MKEEPTADTKTEATEPSAQRRIAAVVATAIVTVAVTAVSAAISEQISKKVNDLIIPDKSS